MRHLLSILLLFTPIWACANSSVRLVVLAPDIAHNLIALGAEESIVGVIENSALQRVLPKAQVVGDHQLLNIEAILALKPDYVVVWQGGNPEAQVQRLAALGLELIRIESRALADLTAQWQLFGELLQRQTRAATLSQEFLAQLESLRAVDGERIRLFYELWHQPLMSVNNSSWISEIFTLCGAQNVLGDAYESYPQVGIEAVLSSDVELILASDELPQSWRETWIEWPQIPAVASNHLYTVTADYLHQLTLETLKGAAQVCSAVERSRSTH